MSIENMRARDEDINYLLNIEVFFGRCFEIIDSE
jgi:hypothetical protein